MTVIEALRMMATAPISSYAWYHDLVNSLNLELPENYQINETMTGEQILGRFIYLPKEEQERLLNSTINLTGGRASIEREQIVPVPEHTPGGQFHDAGTCSPITDTQTDTGTRSNIGTAPLIIAIVCMVLMFVLTASSMSGDPTKEENGNVATRLLDYFLGVVNTTEDLAAKAPEDPKHPLTATCPDHIPPQLCEMYLKDNETPPAPMPEPKPSAIPPPIIREDEPTNPYGL